MRTHDNWQGPIRGSSAWWRGMQEASAFEGPEDQLKNIPDPNIRWELVGRIRKEIAAGAYDTEQKWDAALDRILDELG